MPEESDIQPIASCIVSGERASARIGDGQVSAAEGYANARRRTACGRIRAPFLTRDPSIAGTAERCHGVPF